MLIRQQFVPVEQANVHQRIISTPRVIAECDERKDLNRDGRNVVRLPNDKVVDRELRHAFEELEEGSKHGLFIPNQNDRHQRTNHANHLPKPLDSPAPVSPFDKVDNTSESSVLRPPSDSEIRKAPNEEFQQK